MQNLNFSPPYFFTIVGFEAITPRARQLINPREDAGSKSGESGAWKWGKEFDWKRGEGGDNDRKIAGGRMGVDRKM